MSIWEFLAAIRWKHLKSSRHNMFATEKLARAETKLDGCSFLLLHPGTTTTTTTTLMDFFISLQIPWFFEFQQKTPRLLVSGQKVHSCNSWTIVGCFQLIHWMTKQKKNLQIATLPETNIAPETLGLEDEFPIVSFWGPASCQVRAVRFGECKLPKLKWLAQPKTTRLKSIHVCFFPVLLLSNCLPQCLKSALLGYHLDQAPLEHPTFPQSFSHGQTKANTNPGQIARFQQPRNLWNKMESLNLLPWKLTCPLKINGWKMYSLLKWVFPKIVVPPNHPF